MRINFARSLFCLSLASCGGSSGKAPLSSLADYSIGASDTKNVYKPGHGYSEKTGKLLANECVTGQIKQVAGPYYGGIIEIKQDASYKEIVDTLEGSIEGSFNLAAVSASAGASLAKEVASSELSTTLLVHAKYVGKSQILDSDERALGKSALETSDINRESYCGTDFVSQVDYGASMSMALEITAKTAEDKKKIDGKLKIDFANVLSVEGKLKSELSENKESYHIKIKLLQTGGKPQNSALALPVDGLTCPFDKLDVCIKKGNEVITYLKNQFRSDLESDPNSWIPVAYHTMSYNKAYGLEKLVPVKLTQMQETLLDKARDIIKGKFEQSIMDMKDAKLMKGGDLSAADKATLEQVYQVALGNAALLDKLIIKCGGSYQFCIDNASDSSKLGLRPYNTEFRKLGFEKRAKAFCQSILAKAVIANVISPEDSAAFEAMDAIPFFEEADNVNSKFIGTIPCIDAFNRKLEQ